MDSVMTFARGQMEAYKDSVEQGQKWGEKFKVCGVDKYGFAKGTDIEGNGGKFRLYYCQTKMRFFKNAVKGMKPKLTAWAG